MKETIEHNNRFYGEELKTESEQLKEWLIVANKEIERLKEENEELKHKLKLINSYVYGCDIDSLGSGSND